MTVLLFILLVVIWLPVAPDPVWIFKNLLEDQQNRLQNKKQECIWSQNVQHFYSTLKPTCEPISTPNAHYRTNQVCFFVMRPYCSLKLGSGVKQLKGDKKMSHSAMFIRNLKIKYFIDGLMKNISTNTRQVQSDLPEDSFYVSAAATAVAREIMFSGCSSVHTSVHPFL